MKAISVLVSRCVAVFTFILGLGIVLITANTIKESIFSRRAEIEVFRLCGATDGFVRRPLLYRGALQGLAGALVAIIVVFCAIAVLKFPAETLRNIYDSELQLLNLPSFSIVSALFLGAALGWAGAWHAVSLHMRRLDVLEL
ncbi:MAG: hypothetical protein O3C28_02520 [Proteobacteria bacterium]|nr:hypothetical protein [Pseudomonadota bacterium]